MKDWGISDLAMWMMYVLGGGLGGEVVHGERVRWSEARKRESHLAVGLLLPAIVGKMLRGRSGG